MTVGSLYFLLFLAAACALYYLVFPVRYRFIALLFASMVFYAFACAASPVYLLLTGCSIWAAGLWLEQTEKKCREKLAAGAEASAAKALYKRKKQGILAAAILLNLGILAVLKYSRLAVIAGNLLSGITGVSMEVPSFVLPLGISYYTLIAIGYLVDVYKGKTGAQKDPLKLLLFLCYFPQITQGPISRYSVLAPQLFEGHRFEYRNISRGCQRILWGLFKKFVVAERMQPMKTYIFNHYGELSMLTCFLGCVYMTVWMYADFSGYMDIAAGASELFGVHIQENFKRPFFAKSLAEYWRRWHITLSEWFRDYLFYPLAVSKPAVRFGKKGRKWFGVRVGKLFPSLYAMVFVWFCTGLWHNASVRYVLWGVANGAVMMGAMVLEPVFEKGKKAFSIREDSRGWQCFCMLRTFLLVSLLKVFPGPGYTAACLGFIKALFTHWWLPADIHEVLPKLKLSYIPVLALGLLLMFLVDVLQEKQPVRDLLGKKPLVLRWLIYLGLIAFLLFFGKFGSLSKGGFAYAQF